ncbi:hypothetical protein ONE63_011398 [Megalurothrips usitatus]|uniref:Uncharacterized protein n=1 Tax=Megalurothrips usitatus TaxID=439358 RepID=A0AAV7X5S5_9NEOP|nr:hypothetical protein ONE63_011398 [Megalurothrips usitatus]
MGDVAKSGILSGVETSDERALKEKADEIAEEIEEKESRQRESELSTQGRGRRSKKSVAVPGSASANQVSSALGERIKPTPQQTSKVQKLNQSRKETEKAHREAQDDVDRRVLAEASDKGKTSDNGSQALTEASGKSKTSVSGSRALTETGGTRNEASGSTVSKQLFAADESADEDCFSSDDNNNEFSESETEEKKSENFENCCEHCRALRKSYNQSGALFMKALGVYVNDSSGVGVQFAELLDIPADVPKVEISKKSKVFITVADENAIKADGAGDPSKMTRMALVALFGRQALEQNAITAMGQKSGTLGIRKNVRSAIRAFVNRNKGATFSALTEAQFHRVINREKSQVHRTKKSPQPQNKKKLPKSPQKKTPQEHKEATPQKNQERRSLAAIRSSPFGEEDLNATNTTVRSMASIMSSPMSLSDGQTQAGHSRVSNVIASPSKNHWSVSAHPSSQGFSSQGGLTGFNYSSSEGQGGLTGFEYTHEGGGSYQYNQGGWFPNY